MKKKVVTANETGEVGLVVTTAHRGVFFGYGKMSDAPTIKLHRCRMCVYWPPSVHGVLGLANAGPEHGSRIGPAVSLMVLRDVTGVMLATTDAIARWEAEPWSE